MRLRLPDRRSEPSGRVVCGHIGSPAFVSAIESPQNPLKEQAYHRRLKTAEQGVKMKTVMEMIRSGGSAEFSYHDARYLIQQESNKGCHYLSLWRVAPKAACLRRVCFEVFDGVSEETIEELFSQPLPDGHLIRDMVESPEIILTDRES